MCEVPCSNCAVSIGADCRKVDGQLERGEEPYRLQVDRPEEQMTKPTRSAKVCSRGAALHVFTER